MTPSAVHAEEISLEPLAAGWHLLNFLYPASAVGVLTATLAKLVFRRELQATPWRRMVTSAVISSAAAQAAALVLFGRDGRMAGYGLLLLACSASLWWVGFRGSRG